MDKTVWINIDYSSSIVARHMTPPHSPCLFTNACASSPMRIDEMFYPPPQTPNQERAILQKSRRIKVVLYTTVEEAPMQGDPSVSQPSLLAEN